MVKPRKPPHTPGPPETIPNARPGSIRQFWAPNKEATDPAAESKMAAARDTSTPSSPSGSETGRAGERWDPPPDLHTLLRSLPTREDLATSTAGLQTSLLAEIRGLRDDLNGLQDRIAQVEVSQARQQKISATHDTALATQHDAVQALARHVEDLENRGRRNNRVRGLPESENSPADLRHALSRLFNELLDRDPLTDIEFERCHRALRPRGPPPRDVICCLLRHMVKEDIMAAARGSRSIVFADASVSLFQDLSPATLQSRRLLKPLTAALQTRNLQYKWLFPFGIQVRSRNGPIALRTGSELPAFLEALSLPLDTLPKWPDLVEMYSLPLGPPTRQQRPRRRQRSVSQSSSQAANRPRND
uniref:Uncharacterized protein n=1 Tax=Leptobrachium leishanense TaxID=445787 RepID=A0A8C5QH07_9ANUR